MKTWMLVAALAAAGCNASGGGAGSSAPIGVAECDDYVKKMEACFAKDPATKAAMEPSFRGLVDGWRAKATQGGEAKDGLKQVCSASLAGVPPGCK